MQSVYKRTTAVFCAIVLMMTGVIYRIYYIQASDYLTAAAQVQGKYRTTVATTRGVIYDRNMKPLVNNEYKYVASVLPTPQAATVLLKDKEDEERAALVSRFSSGRPFAMTLEDNNVYAKGLDIFRVPERYGGYAYAPHLVGYLGDGNTGVAGIERSYDEVLRQAGGEIGVLYQMDAVGRMMDDTAVAVERQGEEPTGGVVLTLDRDIQQITQDAVAVGAHKGAAVVLDIDSGDILAMASLPAFDQNDIAAALEREDAPFLNRATSAYNIGSVFKVLVSAGALESGVSPYFQHDCQGYIDVNGQVFKCNNNRIHGVVDMERALEVSCNTYFIRLAQEVEPETLLAFMGNFGLGSSSELASGLYTAAGNLPELEELQNPAGYANFSFGQGSSMATPLQMAQAVAALAGGGQIASPRLVLGTTTDGLNLRDETPAYAKNRVVSQKTAEQVQEMMVKVVEDGSGKPAKPMVGSAGGKTSSAQTGVMDEEGEEIVHAWFAGFYPANEPQYAIVVFVEGGESGEQVAAPIFKQITDGIARIGQ